MRLIEAIANGRIQATTSVEVIQEFVHVRSRRRNREDAAGLGLAYADLLSPLLEVDRDHLVRGMRTYERTKRLGAFDAVLAAAALDTGPLVSADSAFAEVPGLKAVLPDDAAVATLLSGKGDG